MTVRRVLLPLLAVGLVVTGAAAQASTQAPTQSSAPSAARSDWNDGPHTPWGTALKGSVGSDPYVAGRGYAGDFPDPTVVRIGTRYYAYSTTISNYNLPALTSTDLKHWTAMPVRSHARDNDALPLAARWSNWRSIGSRHVAPTWAPTVIRIGKTWLHAYATQRRDRTRYCVSTSRSSGPGGAFVDSSSGPLVCPSREGAIDPYFWRSPRGALYLLWKTEGIRGEVNARLWIRRITPDAKRFWPGTASKLLLTADATSWEGHVIENPAMFRYAGRYYLFYSGNDWSSSKYAVGYAVCSSALGPCRRVTTTPLMKSTTGIAGPGGEAPFLDANNRFRMVYHAWTPGKVGYASSSSCRSTKGGCPQRRMRIARILANPNGTLRVHSYVAS